MQQPEPEPAAPAGPSPEAVARDPFGADAQPPGHASYVADDGLIRESLDPSVKFSASEAGKSRKPIMIAAVVIALIGVGVGYMGGKAVSGRIALNIAIRDALITEYEIKQAASLFDELQIVLNTALSAAAKREYDSVHMGFVNEKIKGNPVPTTLFTERNYKNFDAAAVHWLTDYYNKWGKLDGLIQVHRRKTANDEKILTASKKKLMALLQTPYGVVFSRDKKANKRFTADVVVLGNCDTKKGKTMCGVQVAPGTLGDERELFNPSPEGENVSELAEKPTSFVAVLGDNSKKGLMKNASQSHFDEYIARLQEMSKLMAAMSKTQEDLLNKMSAICSQDPVSGTGVDPEAERDDYIQKRKRAIAAAAGQ